MREATWPGNRLTAAVLAAALLALGIAAVIPAHAQDAKGPNTGRIALSAGIDWTTHYFFRGILQEDQDYIIQPYGDITFKLVEGQGAFTNLGLTVGLWNSLHGGPTGVDGGAGGVPSTDPKVWYEADFYVKLGATLFENLTAQAIYTAYMSPNDRFATVQELAFGFTFNDSKLLGGFALNPSALIAFEVKGQADAGSDKGVYLQLGVAPGYTFNPKGAYPLALTFPVVLGLSLEDYYEFGTGDDDTFGYLQLGPALSVPLAFIPRDFGTWQVKGSVYWLHLGDNLRNVNNGDRNEVVATVGLALTY
jgi:hypothetical protein